MAVHPPLAERWSPRSFDAAHTVTDGELLSLLEAARWAPSAYNRQPWRFLVGRRDDTTFHAIRHVRTGRPAPGGRRRCGRHALLPGVSPLTGLLTEGGGLSELLDAGSVVLDVPAGPHVSDVRLLPPLQPPTVRALVVFLLSDDSSFITGADIPVDGGLTSHGGAKSISDALRADP